VPAPSPGRHDKWYVGAGDGLVWAPPFPLWLDRPGYWDEAHLAQYPVGPLFTVSLVDQAGNALPLRAASRDWTPARLRHSYTPTPRLAAIETRSAPGGLTLAAEWALTNTGRRPVTLHAILWTAIDGEVVESVVPGPDGSIRIVRRVRDRKAQETQVGVAYRLEPGAHRWAAYRSEGSGPGPDFQLTPFYDRWPEAGGLRSEARLDGLDRRGLVYVGLERRLRIKPGGTARLVASVRLELPGGKPSAPVGRRSPSQVADRAWRDHLTRVPSFRCSDPFLENHWSYRWYGLRLNGIAAGLGQYRHDTVCEGIGYFHQPISYSAMCHVRELAWCHDPARARGVVHTFFDRLRDDGSMPGRVYLDHLVQPDFYHADWAGALRDLDLVHPDRGWLRSLYPALARYARWLVSTRDGDESGMIDVTDQYETGQEYMSRYEAVDPDADRYGWENRIRLKGIDVTVYAYRLYRLLAELAPDQHDGAAWAALAARSGRAIRTTMWDERAGMFFDVDPSAGRRTGVKAAVCFYPYFTDLVDDGHIEAFGRHLFDPGEFWTPYPVPSSSVDDARFNPDAEWKGKRHVCPWNGRVWPMATSHVIEALARVVRLHRPEWAPALVHLVRRSMRMMTFDGDPARPNCFEHYHPYTGRASVYRGIDDYQHSWVNAVLARHVAGLLPQGEQGLLVDPLPFGETVSVTNARIAGHRVDLGLAGGRFRVRVDGRAAGQGRVGQALEIHW
jgi:mannosylglycerate hydrolase MGH1-like protein